MEPKEELHWNVQTASTGLSAADGFVAIGSWKEATQSGLKGPKKRR